MLLAKSMFTSVGKPILVKFGYVWLACSETENRSSYCGNREALEI